MLMEVQLTITPWKVCANYGHIWNKTQLFFFRDLISHGYLSSRKKYWNNITGVILYWNNGFRKIGYHLCWSERHLIDHYNDVILSAIAIVYSTVYSGADKKTHKSSASLAFVRAIHRWLVNFHLMTSSCSKNTPHELCTWFIHIHQGYFAGTGARWSNPKGLW